MTRRPSIKKFLLNLAFFGLIAGIYLAGWLAPIDRLVTDLGFTAMPRPASGEVVVVEIDAKSLRQLDVWPWPRTHHAALIDRLIAAGARRIAFDIDFSSRSTAAADQAFAQALERAEGRAILPILKQLAPAEDGGSEVVVAIPIPDLREHAQLAHVNILPSGDDRVRQFLNLELFGEVEVPGLASHLAGNPRPKLHEFYIDYSISPESVPRLSYADVMQGNFDPNAIAGRDVLIGATAIELGDRVSVPVHGVIPGPLLQALAYETLVQDRTMLRLADWPALVVAFILAVLLGPMLNAWTWRYGLAALTITWIALIATSFAAQNELALLLDVAPGLSITLLSFGYAVVRRIDLQAASLFREQMQSLHRRAMMSKVVESSFDGIVITDEDGLVKMSNPAAIDMMGWDNVEIVGRKVDDYIPRLEITDDELETPDGMPVRPREIEATRADGTTFTMELLVNASRMSPANGKKKSEPSEKTVRIFTFRDVTERKRTEEARQQTMDELVAANRTKSEFLATMSHEIRTPMNGVIGMAELLMETPLNEEQRQYVTSVQSSGQALVKIIDNVLDISKLEAGKYELECMDFNVVDVVKGVTELLTPRAAEQGLSLASFVAPDVPENLSGDPGRLRQILINLVGNAVKFTETGSVAITVSFAAVEDGEAILRFEVTDTGIGISEEAQTKLFEYFTQADSSTTRRYGGTGLGLAISKQLVDLMDGEIGVKPRPIKGSTFWFIARFGLGSENFGQNDVGFGEAPATVAAPTAVAVPTTVAAPATEEVPAKGSAEIEPKVFTDGVETQPMRPLEILLAEDNRTNQLLAKVTLEKQGHRVDIANDGLEAVEAVLRTPYDLVLMDMNMPNMDGIEATAKIREMDGEKGRIPIIAVTANAMMGDRETFLAAGMNDYVAKPLDRSKLIAAVNIWASRSIEPDGAPPPDPVAVGEAAESLDSKILEDWQEFMPEDQFVTLIKDQVTDSRACLQRLKEAVEAGAFDDVGKLAHNLKSSCGAIGMVEVQRLAEGLEHACREERLEDALALAPAVDEAVGTAVVALKARYAI